MAVQRQWNRRKQRFPDAAAAVGGTKARAAGRERPQGGALGKRLPRLQAVMQGKRRSRPGQWKREGALGAALGEGVRGRRGQ